MNKFQRLNALFLAFAFIALSAGVFSPQSLANEVINRDLGSFSTSGTIEEYERTKTHGVIDTPATDLWSTVCTEKPRPYQKNGVEVRCEYEPGDAVAQFQCGDTGAWEATDVTGYCVKNIVEIRYDWKGHWDTCRDTIYDECPVICYNPCPVKCTDPETGDEIECAPSQCPVDTSFECGTQRCNPHPGPPYRCWKWDVSGVEIDRKQHEDILAEERHVGFNNKTDCNPNDRKGGCSHNYTGRDGLEVNTGDDMFSVTQGAESFFEHSGNGGFSNDVADTSGRLRYITRDLGDSRVMMMPSKPADYDSFISNPPSGVTVDSACFPTTVSLCSTTLPPVQPNYARCGSANGAPLTQAPTSNLCSFGLAGPVTPVHDSGSGDWQAAWEGPWEWVCHTGSGNGIDQVLCRSGLPNPVDGACGAAEGKSYEKLANIPANEYCAETGAGNVINQTIGADYFSWNCKGKYGGVNSDQCRAEKTPTNDEDCVDSYTAYFEDWFAGRGDNGIALSVCNVGAVVTGLQHQNDGGKVRSGSSDDEAFQLQCRTSPVKMTGETYFTSWFAGRGRDGKAQKTCNDGDVVVGLQHQNDGGYVYKGDPDDEAFRLKCEKTTATAGFGAKQYSSWFGGRGPNGIAQRYIPEGHVLIGLEHQNDGAEVPPRSGEDEAFRLIYAKVNEPLPVCQGSNEPAVTGICGTLAIPECENGCESGTMVLLRISPVKAIAEWKCTGSDASSSADDAECSQFWPGEDFFCN